MGKYILFGAGQYAEKAIEILQEDNIAFIVDNNPDKAGTRFHNIPVYLYSDKVNELNKYTIIISVSSKFSGQIAEQLRGDGITEVEYLGAILYENTRSKIQNRFDHIAVYNKAITWIKEHTVNGEAIICNTGLPKGYPEVTGYYIPSLIRWGYRDLALSYAKWLMSIQKPDGSWYDTEDKAPYIFDSAQILKGLLAARSITEDTSKLDQAIERGCDWILSRMNDEGKLVTPDTDCWGKDENTCSEIIHLYCLSPIKEAGVLFQKPEYVEAANRIFEYYKVHYYEKIMNFSLLSHFYAYLMEALLDLGQEDMCREAMEKIAKKQKPSGAVPAYHNVDWVCSTGLFQLALVWFRLGEIEHGNKAFEYACRLQNESGGWLGSYLSEDNPKEENTYFPLSEISWANKYFLDALYYKNKAEFNLWAPQFIRYISKEDGRYLTVRQCINQTGMKILDVGCGKGRYLRNLVEDCPANQYYGVDISREVMKNIDDITLELSEGSLTNIPYQDNSFDLSYTCEALEHAVDIESAVREMSRVTKRDGIIIIIDKNDASYGEFEICEWEQWLNEDGLKKLMLTYCTDVQVKHGVPYTEGSNPDLFTAWIGKVK